MLEWDKEIFSVSVTGIGSNLNFLCITFSIVQYVRQGLTLNLLALTTVGARINP